jgi:CDP-diacylglycerol--glycerol-3-phosphate 3-phosphatidyltransferase
MPKMPDFRRRAREALRPLRDKLVQRGTTPIQLSYASLGLSAAVGALLALAAGIPPQAQELLLLLPIALGLRTVIAALRDTLDAAPGDAARDLLLREVGDPLSEVLLYLPLALYPGLPAGLIIVVLVLGICTEIAGLAAAQVGAGRRHEGPMAMTDRAIVFGIIGLILAFDASAAAWLPWLLVPASALALATIANRMRAALRAAPPGTGTHDTRD